MLKKIIKATALLCALAIPFSLAGCADTSWVEKIDGTKVPAGVYMVFLMQERNSVLQQYSTSKDPWSQKIENKKADQWAIDSALTTCEQAIEIEKLAKKYNLTLTSTEKTQVATQAQQIYDQNADYKANGVSIESVKEVVSDFYVLNYKLFQKVFGPGGEKGTTEDQMKKYYTSNYVRIKQVFFNKNDDTGNALKGDKLTKLVAQVNSVLAQAKAKPADFDKLVTKYNQDSGMKQNPDGYIFTKSDNYLPDFITTAFKMKVGDITLLKSDYGYHIMYKVKVDEKASFYTGKKDEVLAAMKSTDFQKYINDAVSKAKKEKNTDAINRYNPKNIKTASSTATTSSASTKTSASSK